MNALRGKKITVMGLGVHGGAAGNIRWLHQQGANLTVTDQKPAVELQTTLQHLRDLPDITWVLGEHRSEDFTTADIILRNPAVPRQTELLKTARAAGAGIEMDSSLFLKYSPTRQIIGVTGSKGKSTTAHAIAHTLKATGKKVVLIGVEGTSPLAALSELTPDDIVIFELSSWRLEALAEHQLSPHIAVITSIYRDHLNTYASFDEYIATKQAIMQYQASGDSVLLNYDDERVRQFAETASGRVIWYSATDVTPGEGIYLTTTEVMHQQHDTKKALFPRTQLPLTGEHTQRNMLPGIWLAHDYGATPANIASTVASFTGLPHRLETVARSNGVTYINDSAATIPDATIAALKTLSHAPVVLICGGSDKQLEFADLGAAAAHATLRAIVLLPGTATDRLEQALRDHTSSAVPMTRVQSMTDAVEQAASYAQPGDVVLMSPGATSFGLFQHEFDRGEQFKTAVHTVVDNKHTSA